MSEKIGIVNSSAFEYSQSVASQINTLCEPLFLAFGLTTFIYVRVFYDGKYLLLSNHINWVKNWFQIVHSIENTAFLKTLQNIPIGEPFYFLWDTAPKDKLIQMHNNYGIWHGFDVDYRLEDSVEVWAFCTSAEREQINNFYLNNLKLFHRFCLYFREKASSILEIKDKNQLASFEGNFDLSFRPSLSNADEVNIFLPSLSLDRYSIQTANGHTRLSKRELECMVYLSQGKTAKEIARILNISHRTVESYIMTIRHKTGYHHKSELSDILRTTFLKWL